MREDLKLEGSLGVKEREAEQLRIRIRGFRDSIRELLYPLAKIEDLDLEVVADQALRARDSQIDLKAVLADIATAKKLLGRG